MFRRARRFLSLITLPVITTFALVACGGTGAQASKSTDVDVTLTEFKIESSQTTFSTDVPYHFIVTNKGTVEHEFEIMPPTSQQLSPEQVKQMALAGISGDELPPGATKTLDYTFTKPAPAGELEFGCHLPGHYEAGMHLPIVVK